MEHFNNDDLEYIVDDYYDFELQQDDTSHIVQPASDSDFEDDFLTVNFNFLLTRLLTFNASVSFHTWMN